MLVADMDKISFKVNGQEYTVGSGIRSDVTLLEYLRTWLGLRGTKYMCREAGCGACIVATCKPNSDPRAVNSCMVPITSCHGWEITTIEGTGNRKKGYHPLQKTLAQYNGSQCGYCSPAWVMTMYSLLQCRKDLTQSEIERSLASNVCRCTGYRPILEAFKKFAIDAPKTSKILDIEDLDICKKTGKICTKICEEDDWCVLSIDDVNADEVIKIEFNDGKVWYRAVKIVDIFTIFNKEGCDSYKLICGNTARGAYPKDDEIDNPRVLIDISEVEELKGHILDQNLIIGAETTLTELLGILLTFSQEEYFSYLKALYDHIMLVAHIAVRNTGSIAGNLMLKHRHNEFQSDIFLLLETVGAQLKLVHSNGVTQTVTMQHFLTVNMEGVVILNVMLPPLSDHYKITTFKIMPRSQNAHAIVNAGFLYKLSSENIVLESRIVYGGLSPKFIRASTTEHILMGKQLFTNKTLQSALKTLERELVVTENPPEPSAAYRKKLAVGLFYKGLLTLYPNNNLQARIKSGSVKLHDSRPVSDGRQIFDTNPATWPLNQPLPKIEALIQCAGEAKYTDDLPTLRDEIYAAFVLSTVGTGVISDIDATEALKQPGVISFFSAKDIPGLNSFTPAEHPMYATNEEVFCSGQVKYYNQPLGLIVAETQDIAERTCKLVKVTYTNTKNPVIDIKVAIKDSKRNTLYKTFEATSKGSDVTKVIKGGNTIYGQYHFTMETLACVAFPTEEGLSVYATSQWLSAVQLMISRALKMDQSRIDVHVSRLGGAYGIKISRSIQTAVACSLVVQKLNRPCRIIHSLTSNTRAWGKRFPCSTNFEVGVNNSGNVQYANYNLYEDNGYVVNENLSQLGVDIYSNCYNGAAWDYSCYNTLTDTAKNTWFRAPGTLENIAMAELLMEQISYETSLDPIDVRLANLDAKYPDIIEMLESLKSSSDYTARKATVDKFNAENRWKKRGIRFVFLRWDHLYSRYFDVNLAVYQGDGTVVITHGGVEIGQGINTKAAQVCAHLLNIPLDKIQIKENNTIGSPNSDLTGGSVTTQNIIIAVEKCCQQLLDRLKPVRSQLNDPTWDVLVKKSFEMGVDLQVHGFVGVDDVQNYELFGVTVAEVELDVITGESEVLRVDIMEDTGRSINPELDVGQVEGAFVMGMGYWTCEKLVYDSKTGELLTDRTWNYYVPQARDIPQDFRVYLRKKSYSNDVIFGSKVCGEPPMCMAVSIPIAIREAIVSARQDSGLPTTTWFNIDGPYTTEAICMACATKTSDFKFN